MRPARMTLAVLGSGLALALGATPAGATPAGAASSTGAAADCPLAIRPLPFEEWARGAAAVSIQKRVIPIP